MYQQLDCVAVGTPLGPALASIFVGFHESRLFDSTVKLGVYFRYVDDASVIFGSELDRDHFQEKLRLLHPDPKFTIKGAIQLLEFSRCLNRERGYRTS